MDMEAESSSEVDWYRSLSPGQVSCLQLLYLFPRNYEFHKDEVIQLWIAQELVPLPPSADMEFCARSYFKEFEEHGVFQMSTLDYSVGQQRYKLSNSFVDFIAQNHGDDFFRIDDLNSHISKNTKHASLRDDSIDAVTLNELYKAERLATLLILHQRGTHLDQLPPDLFLNLPLLRVLDLSHTSLTELPSFIGNLNDLRYLNLSYTPITALPKSLCTLYQMQTLKLKGCLKLLGLPKGMRKLINLRHLEVDLDCLFVSMPLGIGDLVELRTIPAFVVGKENGCHITELRNMKNLCGTLSILRLHNVSSSVEAKESALDNKRYLHTVELHWTDCVDGLEVLENLQPHTQLEELQIVGYGGAKFPNWIGEPIFSKLATITICDCRNCEMLPPIGKLPSLQRLSISDMQAVKTINSSFCGKNMVAGLLGFQTLKHFRPDDHHIFKAFQRLENLTLNRMRMLETWSGIEEGDFPSLQKLNISHCPKLTSLPELSLLISLKQLEISLCPLIESFPNKGLPTSLQCLVIIDCPRLKALSGRRDWGELGHIPYIWIDYQQIQANPLSTAVSSPLPSQNLESTIQVPLDTNVEKGKRAGLDSLTIDESRGSSEKRQANPSSTAVNSPLPSQNLESTVPVPLDTNVETEKRAGLDSLTMVESHGSFEKRQNVVPLNTWVLISNFKLAYNILRRPDGTFNRHLAEFLDRKVPANAIPVDGIFSFDVLIDHASGLLLRIYRMAASAVPDLQAPLSNTEAVPVIVFFHGGSFAHSSANSAIYDTMCRRFVANCKAVMVSVNYRRAPENRYPCAYDDGWAAVKWVLSSPWLQSGKDSKAHVFLAGDSSGGNIVHNVALRAVAAGAELLGNILLSPMFGGMERTESELQLDGKYFVSVQDRDWYWRAFLPIGADRSHPACDPFGPNAPSLEGIKFPKSLVMIAGLDLIRDWQLRYVKGLENAGQKVRLFYLEQATIGFYLLPNNSYFYSLMEKIKNFVHC